MENQTIQHPIQRKISNVLVFISVLLLVFTTFLAYQNIQLKKQLVLLQPTASPASDVTTDLTANWKTYTNTQNLYSFRYPDTLFSIQESAPRVRLLKGIIYHFEIEVIQSNDSVENWLKKEKINGQFPDTAFVSTQSTFQNYPAILLQSLADTLEIPMDIFIVKNNNNIYKIVFTKDGSDKTVVDQILSTFKFTTVTPTVDQNQQANNWRTYQGETFSFQYPNSWPDVLANQLSTRKQFVAEGVFKMEVGSYFSSKQGRPLSFQEYREQIIRSESNGQEAEYSLGGLSGVLYGVYKDGIMTTRIFLANSNDDSFIYNLTFYSMMPDITVPDDLLDTILATFKFK